MKQFKNYLSINLKTIEKKKEFNNTVLNFNQNSKKNWYRLSYPIFSCDSNVALIKTSLLCNGLCGSGDISIYTRDSANTWEKTVLEGFWH